MESGDGIQKRIIFSGEVDSNKTFEFDRSLTLRP